MSLPSSGIFRWPHDAVADLRIPPDVEDSGKDDGLAGVRYDFIDEAAPVTEENVDAALKFLSLTLPPSCSASR